MGIRFTCPNGHPLHVKVELAGKRGICPECQTRLTIPTPPGLARLADVSAAGTEGLAQQPKATTPARAQPQATSSATAQPTAATVVATPNPQRPMATSASPAPAPPAPNPVANEPVAWYVRPAAGGQFGPADDAQMLQWVAEGRVGADAHVWRSGWADWRRATQATEHFSLPNTPAAGGSPLSLPSEYNVGGATSVDAAATPSDPSLVTARYKRKKLQAARGQQLAAILLVLLTITLAGVLVWVISGIEDLEAGPASPPAATSPAKPDGNLGKDADQHQAGEDAVDTEDDDSDTMSNDMGDT